MVLLSACSFITVRPSRQPDPVQCTSVPAAAVLDAVVATAGIGVSVLGLAVGCQGSDGCGLGAVVVAVTIAATAPFPFSSYYGFSRTHRCREAIEASRARNEADYEQCAATRARTVAELATLDAERRGSVLRDLPVCTPPSDQDATAARLDEQAWSMTRDAAIFALAGNCPAVVERALRVKTLSQSRFESIFLSEPDIATCLGERPTSIHDKCIEDRAKLRGAAMLVTDLKERGRLLQALPNCFDADEAGVRK